MHTAAFELPETGHPADTATCIADVADYMAVAEVDMDGENGASVANGRSWLLLAISESARRIKEQLQHVNPTRS